MMGSWNTAQAGQPMLQQQQQQQMLLATHLAQQHYAAQQQAQYNMAQLSLMQQAQVTHHNLELIKNEALKLEAAKQASAAAAAAAAPAKAAAKAAATPLRQQKQKQKAKQKQPPQSIYHVTQEDSQCPSASAHELSSFASALSTAPNNNNSNAATAAAATTTTAAASFISAASGSGVSANAAAAVAACGSSFFTLDDAQLLSVRRSEESDDESPAMFDLPPLGFDVLDVHESCDSSPPPEGGDDEKDDVDDDDDDASSLAQPHAIVHLDSLSPQELLSSVADGCTVVAAKADVGSVLQAVRAAGDVAWAADAVDGDAESVSVSCAPVPGGAAAALAVATLGVVPAKHLSRGADEGSNAAQVAGSIATRALEYAGQGRAWYLYCAPSAMSQAICAEAVAVARQRLVADGVALDLLPVAEAPAERPPVFLRSRKPDVYLVRPVTL